MFLRLVCISSGDVFPFEIQSAAVVCQVSLKALPSLPAQSWPEMVDVKYGKLDPESPQVPCLKIINFSHYGISNEKCLLFNWALGLSNV